MQLLYLRRKKWIRITNTLGKKNRKKGKLLKFGAVGG
jgi:hypothetical protein